MTTVTMLDRQRSANVLVIGPPLVCSGLKVELSRSHHVAHLVVDCDEAIGHMSRGEHVDAIVIVIPPHDGCVPSLQRLVALSGGIPVVAVHVEPPTRAAALAVLEAGVTGLQLVSDGPAVVIEAINTVRGGHAALHPTAAGWLLEAWTRHANARTNLTAREHEVLHLMVSGLQNKQIARLLAITERTVKCHLSRAYHSIGVHSRTEAVMWLAQNPGALTTSYRSAS
jgi:DNA-binding NarL/FixJ family response regulator